MLTCKSLFGLGYRGERLIEPSIEVDQSSTENVLLVSFGREALTRDRGGATPSNCRNVLLGQWYRLAPERAPRHRRETCGHGNNPLDRDNRQPSPKVFGLWVQFTD